MKLKLSLKAPAAPSIDEAARWRGTQFNTEITQEEIERLVDKYGADVLGAHYDDGVPTGTDATGARSRGLTEPQTSFNPRATWETPVGIYYYPLSWAKDRIMNNQIPFAGDKKYIYIYRIKDTSKRIDASEAPHNGFIERALLWAAKNADIGKVLNSSDVYGNAFDTIMNLYGGGQTFSDPSLSLEDNIRKAVNHYIRLDIKEILAWTQDCLEDAEDKSQTPDEAYTRFVNGFGKKLHRIIYPIIGSGDKYLPTVTNARDAYERIISSIMKEIGYTDLFYNVNSARSLRKNRRETVLKFKGLLDDYIKKLAPDDFINKKQLSSKLDRPPPPDTVYNILNDEGMSDKKIANVTFYIVNNMMDKNVARVTKYFISEGYEVFEDREDTGTIHTSESTQGVYLTTRVVELVGVYLNRFRTGRQKSSSVDPKAIDPSLLRQRLKGANARTLLGKAYELSFDDPATTNSTLQIILNNDSLVKDKKFADQIIEKINLKAFGVDSINSYALSFAAALEPEDLDSKLNKILEARLKKKIEYGNFTTNHIRVAFKNILEELDIVYNLRDFSKYPSFQYIKDMYSNAATLDEVDYIMSNGAYYDADAAIKIFPSYLKTKLFDGSYIKPETAASNFLNNFYPNKLEERIKFVDWLFTTYPELLEDLSYVKSGLRNLRHWSYDDKEGSEKVMEDSDIYKNLMATKKALEEPQKKVAESRRLPENRFKKLNRLGKFSMIR